MSVFVIPRLRFDTAYLVTKFVTLASAVPGIRLGIPKFKTVGQTDGYTQGIGRASVALRGKKNNFQAPGLIEWTRYAKLSKT